MARIFTPKIVSANDLFDGDVIYLGRDGTWERQLSAAAVATTKEAADDLLADAGRAGQAIGPYLVDVRVDDDGTPAPTHFREVFRERGPSTRPDLGRQAEGGL